MTQAWIETAMGIAFDILEPTVDMVSIEDIAHSLSQTNRFTGHCRFPYPVSQHSRLVSYLVPHEVALWGLLHDASEAYIGDMNRPLKHFSLAGNEYRKVEDRVMEVICKKFGLSPIEPEEVKIADTQMLFAEKNQVMGGLKWDMKKEHDMSRMNQDKSWEEAKKAANVKIVETSFYDNKKLFLNRFFELYKQ